LSEESISPRDALLREAPGGETGSLLAFPRAPARPIDNLPLELSSFVGRERELAEVERLLGGTRLVTLSGPGGAGKTRLALAVAQDLVEEFRDGVWLVELAPLSDPDLVPQAAASALGVPEASDSSPTEDLVEHLKGLRTLLVLDNCEHLIEGCADLTDTLLRTCPDLRILATSREPLRVAGESNYMVPSLSLPDPGRLPPTGELGRYEAVRLFVERARDVDAGFALTGRNAAAVARLCQKLDGIPLAIELAAARVRVLTVGQISEKLKDTLRLLTTGSRTAAARHQTLKATLEWSYKLLSEQERELLERLSVFTGGWALEAAEAVGAGSGIEEGRGSYGPVSNPPLLDLLSGLVDKSLVVAEADGDGALRYRLLETVRQYATEKLAATEEEDSVRQRHAMFFLELAERAEPELSGTEQVAWLDRLESELGNLRVALGWFKESVQGLDLLRLAGSLWRFCYLRGHYEEGRRWLEGALATGDSAPSPARAKAYLGAGAMTFRRCEYERGREQLEEAVAIYRTLGDDRGVASASHMLGSIAGERGDYARSEALHEESLAIWRRLGDEAGEAQALNYLSYVAWLQEKHERAKELGEETLARFRRLGDNEIIAWALINLGSSALYAGDHPRARTLLGESLALSREVGFKEGVPWSLNQLGVLAYREGDHGRATDVLRESLEGHQDLGDRWRTASVLETLAEVLCAQGRPEPAACLFGAAAAVREAISVPVPLCERADHEEGISTTRAELGEAAFEAAFSKGRAMSPQQAAEYAPPEPATRDGEIPTDVPSSSHSPAARSPEVPQPSTAGPVVLRISAFGAARVEKEGRPLDSPDWIQKSRELLYYLLSHPEGRTKEQIGLSLWPEASTAQLRSSFHDTVYRLRRALGGKEWISFKKGRYNFDRSLSYSYDVEAFEEDLSEGRRLQTESPELAIQHLQRAADLYGGDFLEDIAQSEWAFTRQDELRRVYGESLLLLGGLLLTQERHAEAAEAYRRAISHERFLEEAHRGLMRSHAALGERGRALRHYEELVVLLEEQLGATPAPESVALYESLRSGRSAPGSGK
jgi:predicted ATPase/DNA-binding SARP family transcriptional activator